MGSCYLEWTDFQFEMMKKFWKWTVLTAANTVNVLNAATELCS